MVWRHDNAEPFSSNPPDENPSGLGAFEFPVRFAGQYFDKETNLAYNYFRDYDPSVGRYVESDPIGILGGLNIFAYVRANPLSVTDRQGLQPDPDDVACKLCDNLEAECRGYAALGAAAAQWGCKYFCGGYCITRYARDLTRQVQCLFDCSSACKALPGELCTLLAEECRRKSCKPKPKPKTQPDEVNICRPIPN